MSQLNYVQATWETASVDDWSAFNLSYSGSNPFSTETYLDPYIGSYGQMQADAYLNGAKVQASLNADSASKFSSDTVGAYTSFAFRLQSVNLRDGAANFNTGNAGKRSESFSQALAGVFCSFFVSNRSIICKGD